LLSQIMERLIIESLQIQEADRRGVLIDDETLTRAVNGFASQNNMTIEQFAQALASDGRSYTEFREQIRKEMVMQRLQRAIVNRRITITDQDINDLLNSPYYQELLSDEFRVGHILLEIDPDADAAAQKAAEDGAIELVRRLRDGADFAQMAVEYSKGSNALEGGDLGWRKAAELPSLFAEYVIKMEVGEVSPPIASGSGLHIVKLLEQRGAGVQTEQQSLLRHILVQSSAIRTEAETEALIRSLYDRVLAGEDFAELAIEYSQDPGSALNGGSLGWTSGNEFVPEFQRALADTPTKSVSPPFRSNYGWHILEVQDRREQDMSEATRKDMALQILHTRRFEEETEKWLKELRDEAFVEIRI
ncbi:MAG: peptidylprolyl isomerase, partial [Pseudomonadales bacterium]|nr:peptidylprolyl isomerase [Pseudomonadales bacterium]